MQEKALVFGRSIAFPCTSLSPTRLIDSSSKISIVTAALKAGEIISVRPGVSYSTALSIYGSVRRRLAHRSSSYIDNFRQQAKIVSTLRRLCLPVNNVSELELQRTPAHPWLPTSLYNSKFISLRHFLGANAAWQRFLCGITYSSSKCLRFTLHPLYNVYCPPALPPRHIQHLLLLDAFFQSISKASLTTWRVLDIGVGSGILSFIALLNGCAHAHGVDRSQNAITSFQVSSFF